MMILALNKLLHVGDLLCLIMRSCHDFAMLLGRLGHQLQALHRLRFVFRSFALRLPQGLRQTLAFRLFDFQCVGAAAAAGWY